MDATVWKYRLASADTSFDIPEGAEILCAMSQGMNVCLWARINPASPPVSRRFLTVGTGAAAPADGRYVGSAKLMDGALVFHVFEVSP